MKKIILVLALIMLSVTSYGQFGKWSASGEYGIQMIGDKTAVSVDNFDHFGLGLRYNISEIIGVGLTGAYDKTVLFDLTESNNYYEYDFKYSRVNVEGYINTFKWVDVYSKRFTILLHGGPGVSVLNGDGYKQTVMNFRGGATLLYKLSNRLAITGDFSTTANVNQANKFDGSGPTVNTGISSNISNTSIGLTFYLGKKSKLPHADWYVKPDVVPAVNNTYVKNVYPITEYDETNIVDIIKNYNSIQPISEYVFFDHDEFVIRDTELNSIYKVYTELIKHDNFNLVIKGYASPTSSSAKYNQTLSENRSNVLYDKYIDMGIDSTRISFESYGKDLDKSKLNVHDVARRVELIVVKINK